VVDRFAVAREGEASMSEGLQTEVRMIKVVGPQRAELLAKRGIHTLEDLLGYLPFRYENRIHFSQIKDVRPNGIFTLRVRVASGQAVRSMRGRDAIYHLLVQDDTGSLPCKFFHGGYLEGRLKPGQLLVLHGKAEVDRLRPARVEMVNPQVELLSGEDRTPPKSGESFPFTRPSQPSARAPSAGPPMQRCNRSTRIFPICCPHRFARG